MMLKKWGTVMTVLIYAVRVKMRNWYSTCRPVVMVRDHRVCRCTCQVTHYCQDWRTVYFPLFINETNSISPLPSTRREETKIELVYSFDYVVISCTLTLPIHNRCLLSYGLDTFYISLYHIWWITLFGIWDIGHHL